MTTEERQQTAAYLRARNEYAKIKTELASLALELKRFGRSLSESGRVLTQTPASWNVDTGSLCAELRDAARKAERYRLLLAERAEKRMELEGSNGIFPSLEKGDYRHY